MTNQDVQTLRVELQKLNAVLSEYIENDMKWKARAEPMVKSYENTNWLINICVSFLKIVGITGGAFGGAYVISKFLKDL